MAWLTAFLAANGLSQRRARQLSIGLLILIGIAALWALVAWRDARLVAAHDAGKVATTAQADRAADAAAATRRRADDTRLQAEAAALEKVTTDVPSSDPRAARRAYYDCVRVQQQARDAGRLTPAC